ncbi:hypothetical protein P3S68_004574 [Capsicum galapagoense]
MKMVVAGKFIQRLVVFDICVTLILICGLVFSSRIGDGRTKCLESEKEALLSIKRELLDIHGRISSWGNEGFDQDCCTWRGVSCDNQTGHVIGLDLRGHYGAFPNSALEPLVGKISSAIQELKNLKYLDLSHNQFSGGIPDFIGSLSKLEYLNLSCVGNDFTTIHPHIGNLSSLNTLDLSYNDFLSMNSFKWLSRLRQLRCLAMNYIDLSSTNDWLQTVFKLPFLQVLILRGSMLPVPSEFHSGTPLTSITTLDLASNFLDTSIYTWLFDISNLVELDLSFNALDGFIPDTFGNMLSLASLNLSGNLFQGPIPDVLWNMKSLQHLDLSGNAFGGGFSSCFGKISNLKSLRVSFCSLDGQLPQMMKNLSCLTDSLEYLNLERNHIGGSLPDVLANFSSLTILRLGLNELNGSIPQAVGKLSSLTILDLSWNGIVGSVPDLMLLSSLKELHLSHNKLSGLTESIGHFSKLEKLYLDSNQFEGTVTESHLFKLPRLRELDLSFNAQLRVQTSSDWIAPFELDIVRLTHCKLGPHFPNWLRNQNNISVLDLSASGISGNIPSWFWDQLPGLNFLNLSYNDMVGTIPDLSRKSALLRIDLASNKFSGPIPQLPANVTTVDLSRNTFSGTISFVCDNFDSLGYLDLSDNLLYGELPNCWMFKSLTHLNLANNSFSGRIPNAMRSSKMLEMLHLRKNHLTGELPQSLENCQRLAFIDVSENALSGEIPAWIGNSLSDIIVVILRSNNFSGSIPSSICRLTKLQILDLSQNKLSGTIPKCINNLAAMTEEESTTQQIKSWYFQVDDEGDVTMNTSYDESAFLMWKGREFEYSRILGLVKTIDLSSNSLVGEIPAEITSLVGLLGLNLSRNNLTGNIPMKIGQLRAINFLDLSINGLSGKIPTSFSQLSHLGVLNLSYNNLSGRIPLDTQLQTFNSTSYIGNTGLCGSPLTEACPGDKRPQDPKLNADSEEQDENEFISAGFYISMGTGFVFGFWGSYCSSEVGDGKIKCVAIEKEALLRLKEEFLDIHGRLSSCGNEAYNEDCCGWRGVQCDNQTDRSGVDRAKFSCD